MFYGWANKTKVFIVVLVILFVYGIPFLGIGYPFGHDIYYHFSRIQASVELLKLGNLDFSILPGYYDNFGYAVGLFYSTGLLWIPIILIYLGVNFITSYMVLIFFITFLTIITMGFTSYRLFKRWDATFITVIFYTFAVYRNYSDLLERAALGEYIAFAFIPLAIYGLHAIFEKEKFAKTMLTIGMVGLVLSHTISTELTVFFLVIYVFLNFKRINLQVIKEVIISAVLTMLLTAFYWLPMIEMMMSDRFFYQDPWTHIWDNQLTSFFAISYIDINTSLFPYGLELVAIILVIFTIIQLNKKIIKDQFLLFVTLMAILSFLLATSIIPAEYISFLDLIQFPWRFFVFVDYFVALIIGYLVLSLNKAFVKYGFISALTALLLFNYFQYSNYYINVRMKDYIYYDFFPWAYDVHGTEFLPDSISFPFLDYYIEYKDIYSSVPIDIEYYQNAEGIVFTFDQLGNTETNLQLPLVYYQGYAAYIMSDTGNGFLEIYKDQNSMLSINLGEYQSGEVKVFYNGTRLKKIAYYISVLSSILLIAYLIFKNTKKYISQK